MKLSVGEATYEVCEDWPRLPEGWHFGQVPGVAVDSQDRVYVFHRGRQPLLVFSPDGELLESWGEGLFQLPHGIAVAPDDSLYLVDRDDNVMGRFSPDQELLQVFGTRGQPSPDGRPFNRPASVALSHSGDIYVSDGYGASRVHRFSPGGELILSWGSEGEGPGEFRTPHGVQVDGQGRVYVADRENHRIQIFTPDGEFISQLTGFNRPNNLLLAGDGRIYVAELMHRVSVLDGDGHVLARWDGLDSKTPGVFVGAHDICMDSRGDLYVGEVLEGERVRKLVRS